MILKEQVKQRLRDLHIPADKHLGQHFLVDATVLKKIIETARSFLAPEDAILEIGPGLGVLTNALINLDPPHRIIAVEKDPVLSQSVKSLHENQDRLKVIQGDILQELERNQILRSISTWSVVANIPYAITSPLLKQLTYRDNPPHHILVLVQKESAERITALPGNRNRGLLTFELENWNESSLLLTVPSTSFWPSPEVQSALLLLKRREKPLIPNEEFRDVRRVAIAGFSAKRKQLVNSLAGGLRLPTHAVREALEHLEIDPRRRAETLTISEWHGLTKQLSGVV